MIFSKKEKKKSVRFAPNTYDFLSYPEIRVKFSNLVEAGTSSIVMGIICPHPHPVGIGLTDSGKKSNQDTL